MLTKTHLAISILAILIFINAVENKIIFVIAVLVATLMPDIDSKFSGVGRRLIFRPLQFFVRHRGIFHSFTLLFLITLVLVFFVPILAFGFFLGYSLHIFADSFTMNGIRIFYPVGKSVSGKIRTGGKIETGIFVLFVLADLFMLFWRVKGFF